MHDASTVSVTVQKLIVFLQIKIYGALVIKKYSIFKISLPSQLLSMQAGLVDGQWKSEVHARNYKSSIYHLYSL